MTAQPEPVTLRVTRYRCPFCTRSRSSRAVTVAHIGRCWNNPAARACKTCVHYEPPTEGPYDGHPGWPEDCLVGRDLAVFDLAVSGPAPKRTAIQTNCPLWAAKEDDR